MAGLLNNRAINTDVVNGPEVPLEGAGGMVFIEQLVGPHYVGRLVRYSQTIQFYHTGSGSVFDIEQQTETTGQDGIVTLEQYIL